MLRYETLSASAGPKKWVTAAEKADYGDSQALWVPPIQAGGRMGIAVGAAALTNRSGGAVNCGLGARYPVSTWEAGPVTAAGAYTPDTADAQDADTGDFILHDRTASGSGFLVGCDVPFNILALLQTVAGDQGTPVGIVEYWDGAAWVNIVASLLINEGLIANGTGEKLLCWPMPSDWAKGGSGTGVPAARYNLRIRHTTASAGTGDPTAGQLFVGFAKLLTAALANNTIVALIREHEFIFPRVAEALFPVFSVASRSHLVEVDVRPC